MRGEGRQGGVDSIVDGVLAPADVGEALPIKTDRALDGCGVLGREEPAERLAQRRPHASAERRVLGGGRIQALQHASDAARDAEVVVGQGAIEIEEHDGLRRRDHGGFAGRMRMRWSSN